MEVKIGSPHDEKFGRYFIAIIPPEPAYSEITLFKNHILSQYQSKAALNSPPHLTLHMPFEWRREKEEQLFSGLKLFFGKMNAFELQLLNFSCFAPRTIFVEVIMTSELRDLEKELCKFCKNKFNLFHARYRDLPFHPHVTVGFRDLSKTTFALAWNEFSEKKFAARFVVDRVALLKYNGKLWEPLHYFSLN